MDRRVVALLASFEAAVTALIGLGVCLVPLTLSWAVQYHMNDPWLNFWRASGDVWLLGHGVNLTVVVDAKLAQAVGLSQAIPPFTVTFAALGFAVFTFVMAFRMGRRSAETESAIVATVAAGLVTGVIGLLLGLSSTSSVVTINVWQAALWPAFIAAGGVVCGAGLQLASRTSRYSPRFLRASSTPGTSAVSSDPLDDDFPLSALATVLRVWKSIDWVNIFALVRGMLRLSSGLVTGLLAVAAVVLAVILLLTVTTEVSLFQSLQTDYLSALELTLAQLSLVPNAIVWVVSWFAGPGFSLGEATQVTASHATVGTLPGVPLLGTISSTSPHGAVWQVVAVLVPVVIAFIVGMLYRLQLGNSRPAPAARGNDADREVGSGARSGFRWAPPSNSDPDDDEKVGLRELFAADSYLGLAITALGAAIMAGCALGLLTWWSGGTVVPGAFSSIGPHPFAIGLATFIEFFVGGLLGVYAVTGRRALMVPED